MELNESIQLEREIEKTEDSSKTYYDNSQRIQNTYVSMLTNTWIVREIESITDYIGITIRLDIIEDVAETAHVHRVDSEDTTQQTEEKAAFATNLIIAMIFPVH